MRFEPGLPTESQPRFAHFDTYWGQESAGTTKGAQRLVEKWAQAVFVCSSALSLNGLCRLCRRWCCQGQLVHHLALEQPLQQLWLRCHLAVRLVVHKSRNIRDCDHLWSWDLCHFSWKASVGIATWVKCGWRCRGQKRSLWNVRSPIVESARCPIFASHRNGIDLQVAEDDEENEQGFREWSEFCQFLMSGVVCYDAERAGLGWAAREACHRNDSAVNFDRRLKQMTQNLEESLIKPACLL